MITEKNKCPPGYIKRKGYTRKFSNNIKSSGFTVRRKGKIFTVYPKVNTIKVESACIINRGLPGKGPRDNEGIGKLRKGELLKYGYQYRLSDSVRHSALKKAIKRYGSLSVYRKLNAVSKLSLRTAPDASIIFARDRNWIKDNFKFNKE